MVKSVHFFPSEAAEPQIAFANTTLEVARDSDFVAFRIGRSDDGSDQPLNFFLETLQYQGEGSAIPNVDYKNTRGILTFGANAVAVTSMVKLLPNRNRAPFKVFLVRISIPFGQPGIVTPGKDILRIILKDVDAFFLQVSILQEFFFRNDLLLYCRISILL